MDLIFPSKGVGRVNPNGSLKASTGYVAAGDIIFVILQGVVRWFILRYWLYFVLCA